MNIDAFTAIKIIRGDEIRLEPIDWLMKDRIASSGATLIAGQGGIGKSLLLSLIAATITNGGILPGETTPTEAGNVVILSGEEDLATILGPRLTVAGANMSKIHFFDEVEDKKYPRPIDLKCDLENIKRAIEKIGDVRLVIIDPITDFMMKLSSNDVTDVRSILTPLGRLARKMRIAVILVTHLKKGAKASAEAILGSGGFVNATRGVHVMEQGDNDTRIFRLVKTNLADQKLEAMTFSIEKGLTKEGIAAPYLKWRGGIMIESEANSGVLADAKEFIKEIISGDGLRTDIFYEKCAEKIISMRTNQRARSELGVQLEKRFTDGVAHSFYVLPPVAKTANT